MQLVPFASRSLPLLFVIASCSSSADGIWYPQGGEGGKADSFTTIHGSDIPSAYVDSSKDYLISRQISSLTDVSALDPVETTLAARVDGILANSPIDGRLHLAEMVHMEDPTILHSLFPDEVAALPRLWRKLEAPVQNALVADQNLPFGVLDVSSPPGPAVPPSAIVISTLVSAVQPAALRVENVFNSDGDPATVSLGDVLNGLSHPTQFTQPELNSFTAIATTFRASAVATATAHVSVSPAPGQIATTATLGPVVIHLSAVTRYDEQRTLSSNTITTQLIASQAHSAIADLQPGSKVLVINKDSNNETTFAAGAVPTGLGAGPYVFEVWQAGQRVFTSNAHLPALNAQLRQDLTDKVDYTLTVGQTPLVRNLATAPIATAVVTYTYDLVPVAPPPGVNNQTIAATQTAKVLIPVGRYTINSNLVLSVFPNNVLVESTNGTMSRLLPVAVNGFRNATDGARFNTDTSSFTAPGVNITLTAASRDVN